MRGRPAGAAFSVGSSRFSLGVSYAFGKDRRDFAVGGLPPEVPIVGEKRDVDVRFSRLVFVLGYLFLGGAARDPDAGQGASLAEVERRHIVEVLEQTGWTVKGPRGAARALGLPVSTLYGRMAKLGIQRQRRTR